MAIHFADDDEQIHGTKAYSGVVSEITKAGRIRVTTINKKEAPMEEINLKVLLEITGAEIGRDRLGVDIITVLDVTAGFDEKENLKRLNEMKIAMKFLIQKLSHIDQLSIVTYSRGFTILSTSLLQMTEICKEKIEKQVNELQLVDESFEHRMDQPIDDVVGLGTALQVLNNRKLIAGRVPAIMLVSCDCEPGFDAANIDVNVPVYTFGLGSKYDEKMLNKIATKSMGGTFSIADVENTPTYNNLSVAFLQCLAGLLTVVVQDLKVIIRSTINSKIQKIFAGKYSKPMNEDGDDIRTISFGSLYCKEKRRIMVDLLLPLVQSQVVMNVLELTYSYKIGDIFFQESIPLLATVTRTNTPMEQEKEEVMIEEARLRTVAAIEKAIEMADNGELDEAQDIIAEAQNMLEDDVDEPKEPLEMLKYELYELIKLMQSKEMYTSLGHAFGVAVQTSHDTQRAAAIGDLNSKPPMFATPLMNKFVTQLIEYDKDNSIVRLHSIIDDFEQEISNNPIAAFPGALSFHLEKVIQTLKTMQEKLSSFR